MEAERIAQENTANYGQKLYTVLFFDEANTTEAIGLIKEIMCDHAMEGEPLKLCQSLKIVAACNPYRKYVNFTNLCYELALIQILVDLLLFML